MSETVNHNFSLSEKVMPSSNALLNFATTHRLSYGHAARKVTKFLLSGSSASDILATYNL